MWRCRVTEFLFNFVPIKLWQDRLISRHILKCPDCGAKLADPAEARSVLALEQDFDYFKDFRPRILEEIRRTSLSSSTIPVKRRWLISAVGLAAAGLAAILIFSPFSSLKKPPARVDKVQVRYIRIENQPAKTYIYQSKDSDIVFVWAEKTPPGAGS